VHCQEKFSHSLWEFFFVSSGESNGLPRTSRLQTGRSIAGAANKKSDLSVGFFVSLWYDMQMDKVDKIFRYINWTVFLGCLIFVGARWQILQKYGPGICNEFACENGFVFLISLASLVGFIPFFGIMWILKKLIKKYYKSS
jgi:hypothetical protein